MDKILMYPCETIIHVFLKGKPMIINDIEYGILLFVNDEDGNELAEEFFHDFYEMNKYILDHENEPGFYPVDACYSIVEVIDGKPDGYSWTQDIPFMELDEEEIQKEIQDFIEYEKEIEECSKAINDKTRFRTEEYKGGDYQQKFMRRDEISYICPYCMNIVDECICRDFPYQLIQIDTKMVPIIRILNMKGYKTVQCCAGHPRDGFHNCPCIYIAFREKYDFIPMYPSGAIYKNSDNSLQYYPKENSSYDELVEFQKAVLTKLQAWAESLPICKSEES